jgi:hypothetical protein
MASALYRGFLNPQTLHGLGALPIGKSATRQVWKPAVRRFWPRLPDQVSNIRAKANEVIIFD